MFAMQQPVDLKSGLKNILYLTDFSECAQATLPYAKAIARIYDGKIFLLHSMVPDAMACLTPELAAATITLQEQEAQAKMKELAAQLDGQPHEAFLDEGHGVWPSVEAMIASNQIDLIVLGTHARKGVRRFFPGSIAEEIFRRTDIPVLMVGPLVTENASHRGIFKEILVASDFSVESHRAVERAARIAQANGAHLTLLNVIKMAPKAKAANAPGQSVATTLGQFHDQFPADLQLEKRPDFLVQYGVPAERIAQTAEKIEADVIVLGVRSLVPVGVATHVARTTAHGVVTLAPCPVLVIPA